MPLPTIPLAARVTFNWHNTSDPRTANNVLHFVRSSGANTIAQLITDLETAVGAGNPDLAAPCGSAWVMDNVDIIDLADLSVGVHHQMTATIVGGTGTDWVPQVSPLVKLTTAKRGRSYRGRIYLPAAGEGAMDSTGISSGKQSATTTAWENFANSLVTGGRWALGVASYKHATIEQVTNLACEQLTATQRRRNR